MKAHLARLILRLAALRWGGYLFAGRPHRYSDAEVWAMRELGILGDVAWWTAWLMGDEEP